MKVYFASPWFNEEQAERENRVKTRLRELGFDVWSPKDNCVCPPNATKRQRLEVYSANIENIKTSDIVFAITDGKDTGTIWEAGFANGLNEQRIHDITGKQILIVYYCETLGNGQFNLMLAQSGDIVITKFEDLDMLPNLIESGEVLEYVGNIE